MLIQSPSQKSQSKPTGKNKEKFDELFSELLKWHCVTWLKKKKLFFDFISSDTLPPAL